MGISQQQCWKSKGSQHLLHLRLYLYCWAPGLGNKNPSWCEHKPIISKGRAGIWTIRGAWPLQIDRPLQHPPEGVKRIANVRLLSVIFEKSRRSLDNPEDSKGANVIPIYKKDFKGGSRISQAKQFYFSPQESYRINPPEGYHKSNVARLGKASKIHTGQIVLDKSNCLLQQRNFLSWCGASSGHCLPGFIQGFWWCFPQPPPRASDTLRSGQASVQWELADQLHPEGEQLLSKLATCH